MISHERDPGRVQWYQCCRGPADKYENKSLSCNMHWPTCMTKADWSVNKLNNVSQANLLLIYFSMFVDILLLQDKELLFSCVLNHRLLSAFHGHWFFATVGRCGLRSSECLAALGAHQVYRSDFKGAKSLIPNMILSCAKCTLFCVSF